MADTAEEFLLGKRSMYRGEELLLHRKYKGQHDETLVKWSRLHKTDKHEEGQQKESDTSKEFLIWMREEEIAATCPQLRPGTSSRSGKKTDGHALIEEEDKEKQLPGEESDQQPDDSLEEMAQDVRMLVERAQRITNRISSNASAPGTERLLANTINILSAYAKLGSLADSFRQCGALDLLLNLLSFQLPEVRQSAGEMLRSLSAYDSASRAYVLLQLTQREGEEEENGAGSPENRQMLLDLFAETASQEEDSLSCSNLGLAKVPGRYIYSLLKKYLRVTSSANLFGWNERSSSSSSSPSPPPALKVSSHKLRPSIKEDFKHFECLFLLMSELFTMFEWTNSRLQEEREKTDASPARSGFSIFTGTMPVSGPLSLSKDAKKIHKNRNDFLTDREYGEYIRTTIQSGSRVRARVSYESVSMGDTGKYLGTNDGTPPAQCLWDGLSGSYWVHWHHIELVDNKNEDSMSELDQASMAAQSHSARRPYALTAAVPEVQEVTRHQWWEVLCLVKRQLHTHLPEVLSVVAQPKIKRFDDLLPLTPSCSQVAEMLVKLEAASPQLKREPLSVREESEFQSTYQQLVPVVKDDPPLLPTDSMTSSDAVKKTPPFPDPFDKDDLPLPLPSRLSPSHSLMMLMSGIVTPRLDGPLAPLEAAENSWEDSDFSLPKLMDHKSTIETLLAKHPMSCRVAVCSLRVLMAAIRKISKDIDRIDCCVSCSLFSLILQLMQREKTSHTLQALGLKCFFALMGGAAIDASLPISPSKIRPEPLSEDTRLTVLTIVTSLSSLPGNGGLKSIIDGLECVTNCYNLSMVPSTRESISNAILDGLSILVAIMNMNESLLVKQLEGWNLPDLFTNMSKCLPECSTRELLCRHIAAGLQGGSSRQLMIDKVKKDGEDAEEESLEDQILECVRMLKKDSVWVRTPLPVLLKLAGLQLPVEGDTMVRPPPLFTQTFLLHHGVHHLTRHIERNSSVSVNENTVRLLGCLIMAGEEDTEEVVLQGGLRSIASAMSSYSNKDIHKLACEVLMLLTKYPDLLVVMSAENITSLLTASKEKFSYDLNLCSLIDQLMGKLKGEELEKKVDQSNKIMAIIFGGVLQILMAEIEDTRRSQQLPCIPLLSSFVSFISFGATGDVTASGKKEAIYEKIEVSSNTYRKSRLTDGTMDTYWESSGRSGAHWVRLTMKKGAIIKRLAVDINPEDSSYMPQRIVVQGGPTPEDLVDISTLTVPSMHRGSFELVSNLTRHYDYIVIRIKRCQQGGIDVRLRGLTCQGGQSSLWPIFGVLLLARSMLFYFIQAHTWTSDTSLDPLDLFDRLRSVISYEQSFADSYLLPNPARHALGQACRAALFNPLITALTSKERKGTCLSDLLSQYLAHTKPSSSQPSCFNSDSIILMSSTRRMCRLLVDCDGSVAMPSERGSDQTLAIASGSSIVTLATCWQEVVMEEVKQCLVMCDLSCVSCVLPKPHVIVTAIASVYDRLQLATMELFGGHSWFMVAVKEGFTSVFQSLDETAGVRLCEVLCECVNSIMMAEVNSEQQLMLRGQEDEGSLQLSQVTELLQFMNRLDLASVFESFYRNHLSQRFLSHFSHFSLSRERQLVQSLVHCFPNEHPQHMLADIEQSQSLMNEFCQLDLLESLDQLLDKQGVKSKVLPPDALELSRKIWFYRQRSLEVSVLTPWSWSLHRSLLPSTSSLPSPLSMFIEDYTNFYRSAHIGCPHHERSRQLQWTLYGVAIVTCGNLRLTLSTPQMIILVQFNNAETLTYSQLMDATLLPTSELSEALYLLTTEPHPILCSTHSHKHTFTSDTPFLPNTTFQVNEHFVSQMQVGSGQMVTCCDNRRSWKTSGMKYSAHLFEQRRAIIDSAVARTMKREKTMSVDSVAEKVIKGCSVGHFMNGSEFGQFNCSFKDVCASVERLRASGYLGRNHDHPQILVYIPNPGEELSVEQPECSTPVVEEPTTLTAATIPPLLLPSSSVLTSTGAIPPPLPPSSPLGLPRKRSGSNTSPHTNPKRKQQPFSRSSSCSQSFTTVHEENEEKENLLNITTCSVTSSLTLHQVQDQVALLTGQVAAVTNMKEDEIECMLVLCSWNKDLLLQRYFTDKDSLLVEAGLAPPISQLHPQSPQLQCPVCLQDQCKKDMKALWCGHSCCTSCWTSYLQTQVISFTRSLHCTCPTTDCLARPTRTFFHSLFEPDSHVMEHFNNALVRSYVDNSSTLTWCRKPLGCDRVLWRQGSNMDSMPCSKCGWSSCFNCTYVESHEPASCSNIHKWVEEGGFHEGMNEDARSKHLANIISKRCPTCSTQIEKNEGCLNVKCKCGYDFCWRCMKPWRPTHTDYFNCTAKVSKAARDAKKLVEYNQRCASHHKSKLFAQKMCVLVKGIDEPTPSRTLAFLSDACELLTNGHKMLSYSCVAEYYSSPDSHDYLSVLTSHLDTCVTGLQIFLENTLLGSTSPGHAVRMLSDRRIQDGYQLLNMIKMTREKIIVGSYQQYKLGDSSSLSHGSGAQNSSQSNTTKETGKKLLNGVVSLTQDEDDDEEDDEDEDDDEEENDWDDEDEDEDDDDDLYDSSDHDYDDYFGHDYDSDYGFDNPFF